MAKSSFKKEKDILQRIVVIACDNCLAFPGILYCILSKVCLCHYPIFYFAEDLDIYEGNE